MEFRYLPLLATLGSLIMGYDAGMIGSALLFIKPIFALDNLSVGLLASILIPGIMTGNLTTTICADRFQRTTYITLAALILILGTIILLISSSYYLLLLGRFICGIGIGIVLVIVPLYLAEMAPDESRGKFMAIFQLSITFGVLLGYLTSYWLSPYQSYLPMFGGSLILALLYLSFSYYLPTSLEIVNKQIKSGLVLRALFHRDLLKPLLIANVLAILQQFTGINAIIFFAPQIMQNAFQLPATNAILPGVCIMLFNFIFTLIAVFCLDIFGRRPILLFSFIVQAITMGWLALLSSSLIAQTPTLYISALILYIAGFAIGLGPLMWLIAAEIYPISVRTVAMSLTVITNNIAAFLIASSFLSLLAYLGQAKTFWLFCIVSLIGIIFTWVYVPETKEYRVK